MRTWIVPKSKNERIMKFRLDRFIDVLNRVAGSEKCYEGNKPVGCLTTPRASQLRYLWWLEFGTFEGFEAQGDC